MSQGKRFKFAGSQILVQTGLGTSKVVTGISKENPAVVNSTAHGFVLGTVIQLDDISGMDQLDGGVFAVKSPSTNNFALAGVDSTEYDAFVTDSPNLATATPIIFSPFCETTGVNQQGAAADQIDATTVCSNAKEFEQGLADSGTLQIDFNDAPSQAVQAVLHDAEISGDQIAVKIVYPKNGGTSILIGTVTQTSFNGSVGNLWKGSMSMKLSGPVYRLTA